MEPLPPCAWFEPFRGSLGKPGGDMNRTFGVRQSLLLCALVAIIASGCGQDTSAPEDGLASQSSALTQDHVIPTGEVCAPTGAHGKHATFGCAACHVCGGVLQFDPNGPAVKRRPAAAELRRDGEDVLQRRVPQRSVRNLHLHRLGLGFRLGGRGHRAVRRQRRQRDAFLVHDGRRGLHRLPRQPARTTTPGTATHGGGNQCELCHPDAVSSGGVATGLNPATNCGPNGTSARAQRSTRTARWT